MGRTPSTPQAKIFGRTIGSKIATARAAQNLSGEQLTAETDASIDWLRSLESGRVPSPGLYLVAQIGERLGLSLDDLATAGLSAASNASGGREDRS